MEENKKNEHIVPKESLGDSGMEDLETSVENVAGNASIEINQEAARVLEDSDKLESEFNNPEIRAVLNETAAEIDKELKLVDSQIGEEGTNVDVNNQEALDNRNKNIEGMIESYRKDKERNSRFIEENTRALENLKDFLSVLVKQSNHYSESGGYTWQLVEPTQKLEALKSARSQLYSQLNADGNSFQQIQDNDQYKEYTKQLHEIPVGYEEIGEISGVNLDSAEVTIKNLNGAKDLGGVFTLEDALKKSMVLYEDANKKIDTRIDELEKGDF